MSDPDLQKQAWNHASLRFAPMLALLLLCLGLVACGKKPSEVDPPTDVTNDQFPRIYPDPATDPKPEGYAK